MVADGSVDREIPAVAGDVPVELVIAVEPADHPGRAVADGIVMLADGHDLVGAADADADAVGQRLDLVRLSLPVEQVPIRSKPTLTRRPPGAL